MKLLLTFICCGFVFAASGQNAYFVDKKGKKTIVRDDALEIISIDSRVSYKLEGKTWEKYITFKDLDYVISGPIYFKTFNLNKKKRDQGFFVLAETANKKLLSLVTEVTTTTNSGNSYSKTHYRVIIIDNDEMILDEIGFTSSNFHEKKQDEAAALVRKHFSDCEALMKHLSQSEHSEGTVIAFFDAPVYNKCQ